MRLRAFVYSSILMPLLAHLSRAQSPYGTISGIVVDPTGAVIANAEILVVNEATGVQYPGKKECRRNLHRFELAPRTVPD